MADVGAVAQKRERRVLLLVGGVALWAVGAIVAALNAAPSRSVGSLALVSLLIAAMTAAQLHPTFVAWGAGGDDITLDEAILAVGLVLVPVPGVLVAALVATSAAQIIKHRPPRKAIFNVAAYVGSMATGALVIHATVGALSGPLTSGQLLAVAVAVTIFGAVRALLVWLVMASASGTRFSTIFVEAVGPAALSFVITASWGLLMAVAVRTLGWTIVLGAAPFVLLRVLHRAERDRGRLRNLLHTATTAAAASRSRESVRMSVEGAARSMLDAGRAEIRNEPPVSSELGTELRTTSASYWLVVGDRNDAHPFVSEDGQLLDRIAAVATIALDNAEMLERVSHAATFDPLTGLANRTVFTTRVASAIDRCRAEANTFGVLSIDLDRFKRINDSLGHLAGDELLGQVADRLRAAVRATDTVCRMGGDELAVIIGDGASTEVLVRAAERVQRCLVAPFDLAGTEVFITASIGIAHFPNDGATPALLWRAADRALYRAKSGGRNAVMVYDQDDGGADELVLEHDLHCAIEREELWLAYQPVVDADGTAGAVEALIRWTHPELGPIPPDRFLPIAEEVGLISLIDWWALEQAVRQQALWTAGGLVGVRMAVNVSARSLSQSDFEDQVAETLRRHAVAPWHLEIEVTEQVAVQEPVAVVERLRRLRATGVTIAIDDFGTGYSSLSRLHAFPSDRLKIDRSFVATLKRGQLNPIVAATIAMAHHLGLEVVAEGVETAEQLEVLDALGCDASQGWLFSLALPAPEAAAVLWHLRPPAAATTPVRHLRALG